MITEQPEEQKTQIYPSSSYQKDIWLEQCIHKDRPLFNIGGYASINGVCPLQKLIIL